MPDRQPDNAGKLPDARQAWIVIHTLEAIRYEDEVDEAEHWQYVKSGTKPVKLAIRFLRGRSRGKPAYINLTALTEPELDVLKEFLNETIEKARPVVQALDRHAKEAWEAGDDAWSRSYRADPVRFERKPRPDRSAQGDQGVHSDAATDGEQPEHDSQLPE